MSRPWDSSRDGMVVIDDLVAAVSWNNGIVLWDWTNFSTFAEIRRWREIAALVAEHNEIDPDALILAIEKAISIRGHEFLGIGLSGSWSVGERGPITFERFNQILAAKDSERVSRTVKAQFTRIRRREFQASRAQLVLQMLDAGMPYRCVHPGCMADTDLTVDHKIPMSRGGGDEISNLQFMCLPHNSSKGDK